MNNLPLTFLLITSSITTSLVDTRSADKLLNQAIAEYHEALNTTNPPKKILGFRRAEHLFDQVLTNFGINNVALYINMGNAALQGEHIGQAILAYRRALAVTPRHAKAQKNLEHAREHLPSWVPRPQPNTLLDTFFFWRTALPSAALTLIASLCFSISCILIAISICWKHLWARNCSVISMVAWLALLVVSTANQWDPISNNAVVTTPQAIARAADSAGAPIRFAEPLPAGTEVKVLEQRADWARIQIANGHDAWVRLSSLTFVDPNQI